MMIIRQVSFSERTDDCGFYLGPDPPFSPFSSPPAAADRHFCHRGPALPQARAMSQITKVVPRGKGGRSSVSAISATVFGS